MVILTLLLSVTPASPGAQPLARKTGSDPRLFLRKLYAPYLAGDTQFTPTGKAAPLIFDAGLTALIRKDQRQAAGEVGALDGDPICDCQDYDRLRSLSITLLSQASRHATASVRFLNGTTPVRLSYTLIRNGAGQWRVGDIGSNCIPSLSALLERSTSAR